MTAVPVQFPAITGQRIRITVTGVRDETTTNYYSPSSEALPLGIAEVGIPGLQMPPDPPSVPGTCQSNLLTIDGNPVSVRVVGATASALAGGELSIEPCGADASGITLGPGTHTVETALGHQVGWNVDQLVFDSAPGGGVGAAPTAGATLAATQPGTAPRVSVTHNGTTTIGATVKGATEPFELVFGQSVNAGWKAVASPGPGARPGAQSVDLGHSELVDSFANGWPVTAHDLAALGGSDFTVQLRWAPQTNVWLALGISAVGILLCLVLVFVPWRVRRRRKGRHARRPDPPAGSTPDAPGTIPAAEAVDATGSAVVPSAVPVGAGVTADTASTLVANEPVLAVPWARTGSRPPLWVVAVLTVVTGAVGAAIASPLIGLVAAAATGVALALPRARALTALGAVALLVAAAVSVVHGQAVHPLPESSNWPDAYGSAGVLAWAAVVLLGADAVVTTARDLADRRRARRSGG